MTTKPIISDKFLRRYSQLPPIFKRRRDPTGREMVILIINFLATGVLVAQSDGGRIEWLMKWCRDAGRSYTLTYQPQLWAYELRLLPVVDTAATS